MLEVKVLVQVLRYLGESYETCQKYLGHPDYTLHKEKKIESVIFITVKRLWCLYCKFIIILIYILIWQCILNIFIFFHKCLRSAVIYKRKIIMVLFELLSTVVNKYTSWWHRLILLLFFFFFKFWTGFISVFHSIKYGGK